MNCTHCGVETSVGAVQDLCICQSRTVDRMERRGDSTGPSSPPQVTIVNPRRGSSRSRSSSTASRRSVRSALLRGSSRGETSSMGSRATEDTTAEMSEIHKDAIHRMDSAFHARWSSLQEELSTAREKLQHFEKRKMSLQDGIRQLDKNIKKHVSTWNELLLKEGEILDTKEK